MKYLRYNSQVKFNIFYKNNEFFLMIWINIMTFVNINIIKKL